MANFSIDAKEKEAGSNNCGKASLLPVLPRFEFILVVDTFFAVVLIAAANLYAHWRPHFHSSSPIPLLTVITPPKLTPRASAASAPVCLPSHDLVADCIVTQIKNFRQIFRLYSR